MPYQLKHVMTQEDWKDFHAIRRQVLFEARGKHGVYDDSHPDDFRLGHHPMLLKYEGRSLGTVRLDELGNGVGIIRLVAISEAEQRKGHGRVMNELLEEIALRFGITMLYVNAAPHAVGFYERSGYSRFIWDPRELVGSNADRVQMRKRLKKPEVKPA